MQSEERPPSVPRRAPNVIFFQLRARRTQARSVVQTQEQVSAVAGTVEPAVAGYARGCMLHT